MMVTARVKAVKRHAKPTKITIKKNHILTVCLSVKVGNGKERNFSK